MDSALMLARYWDWLKASGGVRKEKVILSILPKTHYDKPPVNLSTLGRLKSIRA